MTSDTGGKGSDPRKPSSTGRRPAPTIDLKATELASEPVADAPDAGAGETAREAAPDSAKAEMPDADSEAMADSASANGSDPSKRSFWNAFPGRPDWPLIGVAAAAGIVFFLLGLATARLFVDRESGADAQQERALALDDLSRRVGKIEMALGAPRMPDSELLGRIASAEAAAKLAAEHAAAQQRRAEELAAVVRETRSRADAAAASAEAAQKRSGVAAADAARIDIDALNERIAALEKMLKSNEAELARRTADQGKSRAVVLASALLVAVERGAPFTTELAAAKAVVPDANRFAALEPFAATGLPNAAALSRELAALMPAMLKIVDSETRKEGGFLDKLQANAERLVRIRPVGDVGGDRPMDAIARIEARAGAADISGALAELSKLPAEIRAPAEGWIGKANARNAALAAARQFSADALGAIGKSNT